MMFGFVVQRIDVVEFCLPSLMRISVSPVSTLIM
jgi:hypothetical protein